MKSKILSAIPFDEVLALVKALLATGLSKDKVAHEVAAWLDSVVDFRKLIGGVAGETAEAVDGSVFYALSVAIVNLAIALVGKA